MKARIARWLDSEPVTSAAALMVILLVIVGFLEGWESAVNLFLVIGLLGTVMRLVMSVCLAAAVQDIRTDRNTQ